MGKTVRKKEKELKRRPNKLKKGSKGLQLVKSKRYELSEVNEAIKRIKNGESPQELTEDFDLSTRQLKFIRFIVEKGELDDLDILLSGRFYISSIVRVIKQKRKETKRIRKRIYD